MTCLLLVLLLLLLLLLQVPPTMRFVLDGEMPEYLLAKDLILQVRARALVAVAVLLLAAVAAAQLLV